MWEVLLLLFDDDDEEEEDDAEMNETVPDEDLDRPKPADVTPDGRQDKQTCLPCLPRVCAGISRSRSPSSF